MSTIDRWEGTVLYDRSLYQQEVFMDDLTEGQAFPPLHYRFEREDVESYLRAVDDTSAVFCDDEVARAAGFDAALVPSLAAVSYGFIYQAMRRRPPTGNLNTWSSFDFLAPVSHGVALTLNLSVDRKYVKRERTYVVLKAVVADERGRDVAIVRAELLFPPRA